MLKHALKRMVAPAVGIAILFSSACQKSPDSSLVVNKDFDKLIEEAEGTDTEKVKIEDIAEIEYDDYVTSFEDTDLGVKVNVNAKVDIPKADHLSVFRVKQVPFTQEFIDKVRAELMGEAKLYDGYALNIETKSDIEEMISYYRNRINELDESDHVVRAEYQANIDKLKKEYESAPAEIDIKSYPSDGKLRTTEELYSERPYYERTHSVYPDGEVLSVITDGSDGKYAKLSVHNSSEKSNQLSFTVNKIGHSSSSTPSLRAEDIMGGEPGDRPENYIGLEMYSDLGEIQYAPLKGESCTLSLEDAVSQANGLLSKLRLNEFEYYDGGICADYFASLENQPIVIYRKLYQLKYFRNIDGVFLTQSSGTKNNMSTDGPGGGAFTKKSWGPEIITVYINDDGIVGFTYSSPVEITETVVENAAIKSFEDVRDTFEKMMIVTKAGKYTTKVYDIDRVRLSYSRISEADSYDTGLIVPVWDFYGYYESASDGIIISKGNATALAINAIDGSIIDPDLGY